MSKEMMISGLVAVVVGVGGFYGGTVYQSRATTTVSAADPSRMRFRGMGGGQGGNRGGFLGGEVLSKDATSITLKLRDGGSKIVFYATSTQMRKQVEGTIDDIVVGKQVMVNGSTNSDGSVTADMIQLREDTTMKKE